MLLDRPKSPYSLTTPSFLGGHNLLAGPAPRPIAPHTNDPGLSFTGTAGNDAQVGTANDDSFDYSQGGIDNLDGLGGNDEFFMGAALDKLDSIHGGLGYDIVRLDGEYDAPLDPFLDTTLDGIEEIRLAPGGHFYRFGTSNGNVDGGRALVIDAHELRPDDTMIFFGEDETDGVFVIYGGKGADGVVLGQNADTFKGNGGDDTVFCSGTSVSVKSLNGGTGTDTLAPQLSVDTVMSLSDSTLKNFQEILLQPEPGVGTINVSLFLSDGNAAAGELFEIGQQGSTGTTMNLTFDGSAETDARFQIAGFGGDDMLIGGALGDIFNLGGFGGGTDVVFGNGGDDIAHPLETFGASDIFDGGQGNDTLELRGDYGKGLIFAASSLSSVETIDLVNVGSYLLTLHDGNVAAGKAMTIDGSDLTLTNQTTINGADEADGKLVLLGGLNADRLTGGNFANTIEGNGGSDIVVGGLGVDKLFGGKGDDLLVGGASGDYFDGGAGSDNFALGEPSESTGRKHDEIAGFDADKDTIFLRIVDPITGIDPMVIGGTLRDDSNFNSDLAAAVGKEELKRHHAVLFQADDGDFAGTTFLVIDANGRAGYQANKDYVVLLTGPLNLGNLDAGDIEIDS